MRFKNHCFVEKCILYRQMKRYQRYYFLLPCKSIYLGIPTPTGRGQKKRTSVWVSHIKLDYFLNVMFKKQNKHGFSCKL